MFCHKANAFINNFMHTYILGVCLCVPAFAWVHLCAKVVQKGMRPYIFLCYNAYALCASICMHVHMHVHMCICMHMHTCMLMYTYVDAYKYVDGLILKKNMCMHILMHMQMQMHMLVFMPMCMCTHMHMVQLRNN